MTPPIASADAQTIATIAFGIVATLISALAVWQGRRAWRRLYRQLSERLVESDLESQPVELEAHPATGHIFELPASTSSRSLSSLASGSAIPEEARLLDPFAASVPSTAPATTPA